MIRLLKYFYKRRLEHIGRLCRGHDWIIHGNRTSCCCCCCISVYDFFWIKINTAATFACQKSCLYISKISVIKKKKKEFVDETPVTGVIHVYNTCYVLYTTRLR